MNKDRIQGSVEQAKGKVKEVAAFCGFSDVARLFFAQSKPEGAA